MSPWPSREQRPPCSHVMSGDGILRHLGLAVTPMDSAHVAAEVALRPDLCNSSGWIQGGITMTLIDVCGGIAAARSFGAPHCYTSDLTTHFLNGGKVGPVRAEARVLRSGRDTAVIEVRVLDTGAEDRLMAVSTMTMTRPSRPG